MKESHVQNSNKFGSDVLKSLWTTANHSNDHKAEEPISHPSAMVESRVNLLNQDSTATAFELAVSVKH